MKQRDFWIGFTWGATTTVAGTMIAGRLQRGGTSRSLRLGKSIQIARPREEVFDAWVDFEQLPMMIQELDSVSSLGNRSHWNARFNSIIVALRHSLFALCQTRRFWLLALFALGQMENDPEGLCLR